jgi:predicted Holliday junction resolvase-like endonuclease
MKMPWGGEHMATPSGWITIILGLIILVVLIFAFYQVNKTLNDFKVELEKLKNALEETRKNTEEVKRKLEEV